MALDQPAVGRQAGVGVVEPEIMKSGVIVTALIGADQVWP
jgi:hypothetical protein